MDFGFALVTPAEQEAREFLTEYPDKFNIESLTTFAQVYINRSRRGAVAPAEAERVLTLLNDKANPDWKTLGDPLPLPSEYEAAGEAEAARRRGEDGEARDGDGEPRHRHPLVVPVAAERAAGRECADYRSRGEGDDRANPPGGRGGRGAAGHAVDRGAGLVRARDGRRGGRDWTAQPIADKAESALARCVLPAVTASHRQIDS